MENTYCKNSETRKFHAKILEFNQINEDLSFKPQKHTYF